VAIARCLLKDPPVVLLDEGIHLFSHIIVLNNCS
jgi:ABC-type thiamine transport system ATPase subunit